MKPLGRAQGIWAVVLTLGIGVASCATQVGGRSLVDTETRGRGDPETVAASPPRPVATSQSSTEPDTATKATIQTAYGQLPLHFEANQGQSDAQVKFLSRGSGYTLFLTSTEVVLALRQQSAISGQQSALKTQDSGPHPLSPLPAAGEGQGEGAVLRMRLVGANPNPQVVGLDELPGKSNYFTGNDPEEWRTNIPTYAKVKYEGLYPGIDLIYYGNQRQLEYDFVVAPGANPKAIRLAFEGLPPHPAPLVAQPSWLRAGWKPAPLGERGPRPSVFAPFPLAADKGRYHEPKDGKAGLHPLSDSPPSKGERKEVPSPFKGEACPESFGYAQDRLRRRGEDGGESGLPLRIDDNGDLILHTAGGELRLHKPRIYYVAGRTSTHSHQEMLRGKAGGRSDCCIKGG